MGETEIAPGVTQVTFSKAEVRRMNRRIAASRGMTLAQYERALREGRKHWCTCSQPSECSDFCGDGQRRNQHCCQKHHYHCQRCGKLVQVG